MESKILKLITISAIADNKVNWAVPICETIAIIQYMRMSKEKKPILDS